MEPVLLSENPPDAAAAAAAAAAAFASAAIRAAAAAACRPALERSSRFRSGTPTDSRSSPLRGRLLRVVRRALLPPDPEEDPAAAVAEVSDDPPPPPPLDSHPLEAASTLERVDFRVWPWPDRSLRLSDSDRFASSSPSNDDDCWWLWRRDVLRRSSAPTAPPPPSWSDSPIPLAPPSLSSECSRRLDSS
uniref:Putative secreted peptide n=1 Tax=Anopheles braziliensis TaxID=58242 RepID=A0A2M3ZNI2_9DIPT